MGLEQLKGSIVGPNLNQAMRAMQVKSCADSDCEGCASDSDLQADANFGGLIDVVWGRRRHARRLLGS